MMEQYQEIKAANPDCLLFYRMGDFYELFFEDAEIASRALGIVLTKRGKHQGADIPMCGVPVERADEYLHKLIAARLPRRGVRADRGPGRGEEARQQERRAARRRAARHPRHPDRRHAARRAAQQLSGGDRARTRIRARCGADLRAGISRHLDRRIPCDGVRPARARRRDRAARAGRDHRVGRALRRPGDGALAAHAPRRHAAHPRRVRRRHRRAAARGLLCGGHDRSVRRVLAPGADRRRRLRHLCGAHPARQAAAAVAAGARSRRRDAADRCRDARQPRADAHALRRTARLARSPRSTAP